MSVLPQFRKAAAALAASCVAGFATAGGCSLSTSGLAFGAYQPLSLPGKMSSADSISDGSISMVCTGIVTGGSYSVSLGSSPVGNSMSPRLMANPQGGPHMQFNVYLDPGLTTIWGDGLTGSVLSGTIAPGDSNRSFTAYGKVPAGQNGLRVGSFSATLLVTLTYNP
ncbi:spore coat U domain-containing protein [Caenimonas sp. SL110]|uniref:spore coat protein U domain-containing protein n=1 Tax=Caenimonas sp. SL110 TaxID=1450524 RepID=UPI00065424A8|nr:spore coat U domain-containing protein [Caenimonas sp. SL110]